MPVASRNRVVALVATAILLWLTGPDGRAQEGVKGSALRPPQTGARVGGSTIARPGTYQVSVGTLIELDYTYLFGPSAPKKVAMSQTGTGAITPSPLGIRHIGAAPSVYAGTLGFFLEATRPGEDTVTLSIDGNKYKYQFKVVAPPK